MKSKSKPEFNLQRYLDADHLTPWQPGLSTITISDQRAIKSDGIKPVVCVVQFEERVALIDALCACFEIGAEL